MKNYLLMITLMTFGMNAWGVCYDSSSDSLNYKDCLAEAEAGNTTAKYNLGIMYLIGEGVEKDYKEAVRWYREAAELGYAKAQLYMGVLYFKGKGVPQDYVRAHMWFNISMANGLMEEAGKLKNGTTKRMTQPQIQKAQQLAREWMAKHQ